MSVDFKAAADFLKSIATAAKVMADALEKAEKGLGSTPVATPAPAAPKTLVNSEQSTPPKPSSGSDRCPPTEWVAKHQCLGLAYSDLVAMYNKQFNPAEDVSGAEQNGLGKDAAEFGSEKKFLDGMNVSQILLDHGCSPIWGGMPPAEYKEERLKKEIEIRNLSNSGRLLDRFLALQLDNPAKTVVGTERVKEAYNMSILTSVIVVGEDILDFPTKNLNVETIRADSEDAKRLPEGAKVVGILRYAVQFE